MREEQQSLKEAIIAETREEVFAITRKALTDLADTALEASMSAAFMRRLRAITGEDKTSLDAALKNSRRQAIFAAPSTLPQEQRARSDRPSTKPSRPI